MIVYRLTCIPTGKVYIGITKLTAEQRFAAHWYHSRNPPKGERRPILLALRKYGRDVWLVETIAEASSWQELCHLEIRVIAEHRSTDRDRGYNATTGGEGAHGIKQSPEHVEKRVSSLRGRPAPEHVRQAVSRAMKGKPKSPEHIAKLVAARVGFKKTAEQIERSASFHRGRKRSAAVKTKMAVSRGKWWKRHADGEAHRQPDPKINPGRDAAIAAHHFETRSLRLTGEAFGIGAAAAHHAVYRAIERIKHSLEAADDRFRDVEITAPVHPSWLDLAQFDYRLDRASTKGVRAWPTP